jgi:hypothetical protein
VRIQIPDDIASTVIEYEDRKLALDCTLTAITSQWDLATPTWSSAGADLADLRQLGLKRTARKPISFASLRRRERINRRPTCRLYQVKYTLIIRVERHSGLLGQC